MVARARKSDDDACGDGKVVGGGREVTKAVGVITKEAADVAELLALAEKIDVQSARTRAWWDALNSGRGRPKDPRDKPTQAQIKRQNASDAKNAAHWRNWEPK